LDGPIKIRIDVIMKERGSIVKKKRRTRQQKLIEVEKKLEEILNEGHKVFQFL